jgi:hypothetical protein
MVNPAPQVDWRAALASTKCSTAPTNFTWRGFYVQSNNAVIVNSKKAVNDYFAAFDDYFTVTRRVQGVEGAGNVLPWDRRLTPKSASIQRLWRPSATSLA